MTEVMEGGCACGAVRYRLDSLAHVRALLPLSRLPAADRQCLRHQRPDRDRPDRNAVGRPEPVAVPTDSGRPHRGYGCPGCRIAVWSEYGGRSALRFVRVGTLDDPAALGPDVHIYVRSKLPWVSLPESVPAFDAYYDARQLWPAASLERRRAAFG